MVQELGRNFEQKNAIVSSDLSRLSESVSIFGKGISIFRFWRITLLTRMSSRKNIYANDIEIQKFIWLTWQLKSKSLSESIERSVVELQDLTG